MSAAPRNRLSMSTPCRAAGSRPTTEVSDVRPPTQSSMGKRATQPSDAATPSNLEPTPVTATACLAKEYPCCAKYACALTMPLRVSGVPPDLEMTTTRVSASGSCSSTRSMPSGSVLSRKRMAKPLPGSASATSSGPKAEPPMPMTKQVL